MFFKQPASGQRHACSIFIDRSENGINNTFERNKKSLARDVLFYPVDKEMILVADRPRDIMIRIFVPCAVGLRINLELLNVALPLLDLGFVTEKLKTFIDRCLCIKDALDLAR